MDTIIVTVTDDRRSFFVDLEIPTEEPMKQLKQDIVEVLNEYFGCQKLVESEIRVKNTRYNTLIQEEDTLKSSGVWNGGYLELVSGGEKNGFNTTG